MVPERQSRGIENPSMRVEPGKRGIKPHRGPEKIVVTQLKDGKGGDEGVLRHAADGEFRPNPARLLEGCQIAHAACDGQAMPVLQGQAAEAKSRGRHVSPAA